jgi:hypothetical protein
MGMGQFFPSGYGYDFVCPLGILPTAIPNWEPIKRYELVELLASEIIVYIATKLG